MRKRLWQLHSWLGLIAGLGLLVIGLTGSVLVFREELEALLNAELVRVTPAPTGRLPFDILLARVQEQLPDHEVTGWTVQNEAPHTADVVYVIRHGTSEWLVSTLNPYTGQLLASPRLGTATLSGWLLELHYAFFTNHFGVFVVGLFGVLLCILGVTGVWMYREFWKHFLRLRWRRGARLLFSDAHKFVGITSVVFNLIVGFTGAYWNLTHVVEELRESDHNHAPLTGRLYGKSVSLDALVRDAGQRLPGFRTNYISLPSEAELPELMLWGAVEPRGALVSPYGSGVQYDPQTGANVAVVDLRTAGWWARVTDAFAPLHYGTFGGLPVKVLWSLGGLAPGILGVTGFLIWRSRRTRREPMNPALAAARA